MELEEDPPPPPTQLNSSVAAKAEVDLEIFMPVF